MLIMSVSVRTAKFTDIHELVPLAGRTFPLACPADMDSSAIEDFIANELNEDVFIRWLTSNDAYVLVATDGPMLVGYTVCIHGELPEDAQLDFEFIAEESVMLSKFYVHPDFHGAGVSKKMMAHLLEQYVTSDRTWMWLGTNAGNERAIGFYKRVGFQQAGTRTFQVGGVTASDVILGRTLPSL